MRVKGDEGESERAIRVKVRASGSGLDSEAAPGEGERGFKR